MNNEPTYTLWSGNDLISTRPHTTENYIDLLSMVEAMVGHIEIHSSRDGLVYDSDEDGPEYVNECGMTDVEADADTLASAGYGTDEDYGYYGD